MHSMLAAFIPAFGCRAVLFAGALLNLRCSAHVLLCVMQYKVCYNQVVAEMREDTEESGAFDLPPEPLMETYVVASCLHSALFRGGRERIVSGTH